MRAAWEGLTVSSASPGVQTNCTNCSFFEPFVLNADGTIKLNAKEARMEADLWRRLFGDRYSHGFCAQYHGRAHCRARAEGQWNYDAQSKPRAPTMPDTPNKALTGGPCSVCRR